MLVALDGSHFCTPYQQQKIQHASINKRVSVKLCSPAPYVKGPGVSLAHLHIR